MLYRPNDVMGYVAGEDVYVGVLLHIYGQTVVALACLKAGESVVSMPELFLKLNNDYKETHARKVLKRLILYFAVAALHGSMVNFPHKQRRLNVVPVRTCNGN